MEDREITHGKSVYQAMIRACHQTLDRASHGEMSGTEDIKGVNFLRRSERD